MVKVIGIHVEQREILVNQKRGLPRQDKMKVQKTVEKKETIFDKVAKALEED